MDPFTLSDRIIETLSSGLACHDAASLNDLLTFLNYEFSSSKSINIDPFSPLDCYHTIIHIYILFPTCVEISILRKVLFCCILNLPGQDFREYVQLLPYELQLHPHINPLVFLDEALQTGNFASAWNMINDSSFSDLREYPLYKKKFQDFIAEVLALSYHTLPIADACKFLDIPYPSPEFDKCMDRLNWVVQPSEDSIILKSPENISGDSKHNKILSPYKGNIKTTPVKYSMVDSLKNYYFNLKKSTV